MLAAVIAFRDLFKRNESTIAFGHLQTQLDAMELRLIDGEVPQEEWEQFQLQFNAFQGELMGSLRKRAAMIAMSAEAHWLRDPQRFANDANAQKVDRQRAGEDKGGILQRRLRHRLGIGGPTDGGLSQGGLGDERAVTGRDQREVRAEIGRFPAVPDGFVFGAVGDGDASAHHGELVLET